MCKCESWEASNARPSKRCGTRDAGGEHDANAVGAEAFASGIFHKETCSIAYLAEDPATGRATIIDPVFDWDEKVRRVATTFANAMRDEIVRRVLDVTFDPHPHVDRFR